MLRTKLFLVLVFSCIVLAGCGRATHIYTDTKAVKIDSISHVKDGNFLVVSAVLINNDDDEINHAVYRMLWFDENGAMIEQSSWRPVVVKGGMPVHVKMRSTVPGAKDYTLYISNDAS
ncbi:MAG: hypothetical protein DELT_01550 [Desulfovibrio sp.]